MCNQDHAGELSHDEAFEESRARSIPQARVEPFLFRVLDFSKVLAQRCVNLFARSVVGPLIKPIADALSPGDGGGWCTRGANAQPVQSSGIVDASSRSLGEPVQERDGTVTLSPYAAIWKDVNAPPARLEHSRDLSHRNVEVGNVLHHLVADDDIERCVGKWDAIPCHAVDVFGRIRQQMRRVITAFVEHIASTCVNATRSKNRHDLTGSASVIKHLALRHQRYAELVGVHFLFLVSISIMP